MLESRAEGGPLDHIWALLIGVEDNPKDPIGPDADLENMRVWLDSRNTPPDNIRVLQNEEATRDAILGVFASHLIHNPAIPRDAPILIYYSGHGAHLKAPAEWVKYGEATKGRIECIIPHDALPFDGNYDGENEDYIEADENAVEDLEKNVDEDYDHPRAIPDRTIAALLRQLARAKGNNITVIFDCCHSAHGTRGINGPPQSDQLHFRARSIPAKRLRKMTANLDRGICEAPDAAPFELEPRVPTHRGAILGRQNDTHVFLAACSRIEKAQGNKNGGLFTRALIEALYELGDGTTYEGLYKRTFEWYGAIHGAIAPDKRPPTQTPQCEGVHRDRKLFAPARGVQKWFTVTPGGVQGTVEIHAGENALVRRGTRFRLIGPPTTPGGPDLDLGPARATLVKEIFCVATADPALKVGTSGVRAQIVSLDGTLRYAVRTSASTDDMTESSVCKDLDARLAEILPAIADVVERVEARDAPDVILEACSEGVRIIHADPHLRSLELSSPIVATVDIAKYFPAVLGALVRFHGALELGNPGAPHAGSVDIVLHHLPSPPSDTDDEKDLRNPGIAYEFAPPHREAVVAPGDYVCYALMLHSQAHVGLFPHVLILDPMTLEVGQFYSPLNPKEAPLRPGKKLQLGCSEECYDPLTFCITPGQSHETSVLKIVLATRAVDLEALVVPPVLGYNDEGQPHLGEYLRSIRGGTRGTGTGRSPFQGVDEFQSWDTLTRFITVRPDGVAPAQ